MHDGPAQTMTNLVLRAEICERLIDIDVARARTELAGLKTMVNGSLQATRGFIFDLRPMILDDLGLEPTLRGYLRQFSEKNKLEVNLSVHRPEGPPAPARRSRLSIASCRRRSTTSSSTPTQPTPR